MRNKWKQLSRIVFLMPFLMGLAANIQAQPEGKKVVVNGVNINDLADVKYIQLFGVKEDGKLTVIVDYGIKLDPGLQVITGNDGKPQDFESMVGVLNFMHKNGWEFVNAYEARKQLGGMIYHFLLRKKDEVAITLAKE